MTLAPEDDLDEEELQELQKKSPSVSRRQQPTPAPAEEPVMGYVLAEVRRAAVESPMNCVAVCLLFAMSVAVICIAIRRDMRHDWDANCDGQTKMAKHFYCYNATSQPGVHRRLSQVDDPFDR